MSVKEALHKLIDEVIHEPETAIRRLEYHELVEHDPDDDKKGETPSDPPEGV